MERRWGWGGGEGVVLPSTHHALDDAPEGVPPLMYSVMKLSLLSL